MIIEVGIEDEQPRRYHVRRQGNRAVVRHLDGAAPGDGKGAAEKETSIDWRRPQPGIYSLLIDHASYEIFVEEVAAGDLTVHLVNRTFRVHAADMRRHRAPAGEPGPGDGLVRITAPIPGRVSRILVEPGQQISRGDGVIVVEAMKMENELRAPRDGVVGSIEVEEGQGVEGGALLATIE
jgi:biotin carboxyl carrier protein